MQATQRKSLRPKAAAALLGIHVATLWRWASERADFPKCMRLSSRATVWDEAELIAWRDAQRQASKVAA